MTEKKPSLGIGLIGTGFMGKCHALAFRAAPAVFGHLPRLDLAVLADVDARQAEDAARAFGFERATDDWRDLVADPAVDIVAITAPNYLHQEMAEAAITAGKHVYCEKPLALDAAGAGEMTKAAETAGMKTLVGYNYLHNPAIRLAKDMIEAGEIGEIVHFRGAHFEDYLANPEVPYSWRSSKAKAGAGVVADLGSHIISLARRLVGEIEAVQAMLKIVVDERPLPDGSGNKARVEVDDQAQMLLRFQDGPTGTIEASAVAAGRKMHLAFELTGSKGTLAFDQERMNELRLFRFGDDPSRDGFKTILTAPAHQPYDRFCPAPGHGLGFNDLKVIEVAHLIDGITTGAALDPDFRAAWQIAEVVDAAIRSDAERCWTEVRPVTRSPTDRPGE
ncbi:MAG: Gfo/Idh/MocA family oxidoreductase [Alphaproteobacteria bacterium]|nr:Gfo/Idh/MocA family oxidoreductase [Alphaproteobacteria bacterium]